MTTSIWTRDAVAAIADTPVATIPTIEPGSIAPILPGFDLWDYWPVQECDGGVATIAGGTLFMLLSAPVMPDPEARHAVARIRLMLQTEDRWCDLGDLLPDGFAPGSREWSGSAIVSPAHDRITLYFTAAGHRGEPMRSFDQRLFETCAALRIADDRPILEGWSTPVESVVADGAIYMRDMAGGGGIGTIKAFRDPAWFRDPADGRDYLVFAASLARSGSQWNGAVGVAVRGDTEWVLADPLIHADGVNNELERPHLLCRDGRYYCFWSTQQKVFAADGPTGPTGLYGMVASSMAGPWRPLNRTGLVAANPDAAPFQAYSWLVCDDLRVLSFVDRPGLSTEPADAMIARQHFGGTPAPILRLRLDDAAAVLVVED